MKLLIILLVALPTVIFAQTNFHQGYVVKSNGDTVKGYIDYREWSESPLSVDFKATKNDQQTQHFDPTTSRGFGVNGMETYITYNGLISNDLNHFPNLAVKLDTSKVQATVFLRLVTSGGHLSFYSQADSRKYRYFVSEGNATPVELKYTQYYNEQHDAVERAFFRGQLIFYINKYAPEKTGLVSQAESITFEQDQIEKIVYQINGDTVARANGHTKATRIRWNLGAAFMYSQLKGESGSYNGLPQISFGFDVFDNPNVQQWVFRTSISFSDLNVKAPTYSPTTGVFGTTTFDQTTFSVTPQILYNLYNKENLKVFVGGGASLNLSGYSDGYNLGKWWYNLPLTAGVSINKRIEAAFTFAPYEHIVNMRYLGLGVKVYLDK
jgi:hypothetical protein